MNGSAAKTVSVTRPPKLSAMSGGFLASRLSLLARCRLCRTVTVAVFAAIMVVEAIILIPSYRNYERDLLDSLVREGRAMTLALTARAGADDSVASFLAAAQGLPKAVPLLGGVLYDADGGVVGRFGEMVHETPAGLPWRSADGRRFEASWPLHIRGADYRVVSRLDASNIAGQLTAFVFRIAGLVLLIALSVTVVAMVILDRAILTPLLALRADAVSAGCDPDHPERHLSPIVRDDELGDLARAFNGMLTRIAQTMETLRASQDDLRAAKERADRASSAKSDFLANMSHELRTPLNAVLGFSEMMKLQAGGGALGPDKVSEYATDIHKSGRYLLALINDILDLSKAEAGELALNEAELSVADVVEAAERMVEARAGDGGVVLRRDLAADLPLLRADPVRLQQIVLNLMTNAVKFTPPGGTVTVRAAVDGRTGGVTLSVTDTGTGIAAEDIPRVLEPFGQAVNAQGVEGTGLGLPLTRRLAELHGAAFDLESGLGDGTRVSVCFPAERLIKP